MDQEKIARVEALFAGWDAAAPGGALTLLQGGEPVLERRFGRANLEHALAELSEGYRLVLITKGDLMHQEQKLAASGLGDLFVAVEIVSEKNASTYARVFERHGTGAAEAAMCGNSLRSDILPALEAGAFAAHIPYPLTWAHEMAEPPAGHPRFAELASISEFPAWAKSLG